MKQDVQKLRQQILPILRHHQVKEASLFGSYAKGTMKKGSDIDILVRLSKTASLLDFVGMKQELEQSLKRKVDLVEYETIKPLLRESIMRNRIELI